MLSSAATAAAADPAPISAQPVQVKSFSSFPVNKVWKFDILLSSSAKQTDLAVNISNPILGPIDKQLDWSQANKCQVAFRVPMVGIYTFNIELANQERKQQQFCIQFQAKAYDLSKVFINKSSSRCKLGESYEFSVDASEAGEGQLEIAVNEGEIPNQVQVLDNGKCIVSFIPEDCIPHLVDIKFNGHDVNGCPFEVEVSSDQESADQAEQEQQLGTPELIRDDKVLVNTSYSLVLTNLRLSPIEKGDLIILDPENKTIDFDIIEDLKIARHEIRFLPTVVGDYSVELGKNSKLTDKLPADLADQFPYTLKVFDYTKVIVSEVTNGVIGHPIYFFIDASQAGSGNAEIRVSSKTRVVPNYPQSESNARLRVYFTPTEATYHTIDVKFNGMSVPGNPFLVKVAQYPQARLPVSSQDSLKYIGVDELVEFYVDYIGNLDANKNQPPDHTVEPNCQVYTLRPDMVYSRLNSVELEQFETKNEGRQYKFKVSFKPTKIGPYKLFIVVNNELIPGCPVVSSVYNINEVRVSFDQQQANNKYDSSKYVAAGQINSPFTFMVDASRAGEGTLALAITSGVGRQPVQTDVKVSEKGHCLYHLTFEPTKFAPHSIDMSFNERTVPSSPFVVDILNEKGESSAELMAATTTTGREKVASDESRKSDGANLDERQLAQNLDNLSLKSSLKKSAQNSVTSKKSLAFGLVNSSNIVYLESGVLESSDKSQIILTGPNNKKVPFVIGKGSPQPAEPKKPFIEYKPKSIGTYTISIVDGSRYLHQYFVEICDPSLARISDLDPDSAGFEVGRPIRLCVDSRESGEIQLDLVSILGPKRPPGGQSNGKLRDGDQSILGRIKSISSPSSAHNNSRQPVEYSLTRLDEFREEIKFVPLQPGKYTVDIRCLGQPIGSSPLEIEVKGKLAADGKQEDIPAHKQSAGPTNSASKQRAASVSREDELLRNIVVHGVSLKCSPVNSTGAFIIETDRLAQARDFDVLITDPGNNLVDVQCYLQQDGNLLAEWTPKRIGTHKIEVLYKNRQVPGSPFVTEAFDPSGVVIENIKSTVIAVNDKIEFRIDRKQAGFGELDVAITSPLGQDLPIDIKPLEEGNEQAVEVVSFTPTAAGKYKMSITLGGYEIPKSPITFTARADTFEPVKVSGSGLRCAEVNRSAQFVVDSLGEGELKIRIECGDREIVPKVEKYGNSYTVKYKPTEVGYASISLYWNGSHIEGSPHSVPVNDLTKFQFLDGCDRSPNHSVNQTVAYYEPKVPCQITVDASRCGPGQLKAEAYCRADPSLKFSLPVVCYSSNRYRVEFLCPPKVDQLPKNLSPKDLPIEATYLIRFYYNNLVVPENFASVLVPRLGSNRETAQSSGSELSVNGKSRREESSLADEHVRNGFETNNNLSKPKFEASRPKVILDPNPGVDCPIVALRGHGLVDAKCGEKADFTIDGSQAGPGKPEVRFSGSTSDDVEVNLEQIDDRIFKATYIVHRSGIYSFNVLWDGKQVAGCPISVNVQGSCDASKVLCTGDGLRGGVLGQEIKCFIDTRRAGPGELTALCTGRQKAAACELLDRGDGTFELYIKPQEQGRQFLTIKYGGQHIPKSPFLIKVSGKPDPSKVRVHGPGVEHGVLSLYQSRFVCDTRGAGAGQLTVRIRGPKGAFRMETERESQRDRTILCKYDPTEPGDYHIEIKWSGRHVPGSPFLVMIFDTQEELNRFLVSGHPKATSNKLGPSSLLHHQVPYQQTIADHSHYSTLAQQTQQQRQPPFRLQ